MKKSVLLLGLVYCMTVSCGKDVDKGKVNSPIEIEQTPNEAIMTGENKNFAIRFFSTIYSNTNDENIFVSPFSMSMALGVLRNGAEGQTKQEIQKVLEMENIPDEEVNAYYKKLKEMLIATDPTLKLAIANSVWYNKNRYTIKTDFSDLSRLWFDTQITGLDYSSPAEAVKIVNQWCEDNTNGLIKEMLKSLKDIEILNALYFKGDWSNGYDFEVSNTEKQDFTKEDGRKVKVDMMNNNLELPYYEDDYLSLTSIPYGNRSYSMYFILPKENISFGKMMGKLSESGYWEQCLSKQYSCNVDISVPKFKMEYKHENLSDILSKMGMKTACSLHAEFPHIADNAYFFIERVTQKTYIQVDEKGTEAAAVTEIVMVTSAMEIQHKTFRADRTFLFLIQENSTGTILFMGKAGNPVE